MPLVLDPIQSGYNLSKINENFEKIQDTWDEKLDRVNSGSFYNQMDQTLDMNSNEIINVKTGDSDNSLVTKGYVDTQDEKRVLKAGDSMTGQLNTIDPVQPSNATNKRYVDGMIATIDGVEGIVPLVSPRQQGDGVTTVFPTIVTSQHPTQSYSVNLDGVTQRPQTDFTADTNGNVVFAEAPEVGVDIDITVFEPVNLQEAADFSQVTATGSTTPRTLADRFADVVNIKDFGAPDGGDITAALAAALAVHKTVHISEGVYTLSDTIIPLGSTIVGDNVNIELNNCGLTFPDYAVSSDVNIFADQGDTQITVDDATGLEAGQVVRHLFRPDAPAGEQPIIDRSLDIDDWGYTSQINIITDVTGNVVTYQTPLMLDMEATNTVRVIPDDTTTIKGISFTRNSNETMVNGTSRLHIEDCTFDGAGGTTGMLLNFDTDAFVVLRNSKFKNHQGGGSLIQFSYAASHCTVDKCEFSDYNGTDACITIFYGSHDNTITNCKFHSSVQDAATYGGVALHAKSWNNVVDSCSFNGGYRGLSFFFGAFNNTVTNCVFNNRNGIWGYYAERNIITGCQFVFDRSQAVYADRSQNLKFSDCQFKYHGVGLGTAFEWRNSVDKPSTHGFSFVGCQFTNSRLYFNYVADSLTVDSCQFRMTTKTGFDQAIQTYSASASDSFENWKITNNEFRNCNLRLEGVRFANISGNTFDGFGTGTNAIEFYATSRCNKIHGNHFEKMNSIALIGSSNAQTCSFYNNSQENVTNFLNCTGSATGVRPNPGFEVPTGWIQYPQTISDYTAPQVYDYFRAMGNGATDHTQWMIRKADEALT